ncbi:MAG: hypothetical protein RR237_04845 [Acetivibrio sp.]
MFDFFKEVMNFDLLGGFDEESENDLLIQQAEEMGLNIEDYHTLDELREAMEERSRR